MNEKETQLAKNIGEQMSGKVLCPRDGVAGCLDGQTLAVCGTFENTLFCPHCEMEVEITVKYVD